MTNTAITSAKETMNKSIDAYRRELGSIRAGKANASILNRVQVEYYGAPTPLNQLAAITIPEARVLLISPYDKSALENIEKAILASDLGLNPANDGDVIRLVIPQLTGERRIELSKEVGKVAESAKIAIRNIRRDAIEDLKKQQKNAEITEDALHTGEKDIQKITDDSVKTIDEISAEKSKEITEG